MVSISFSELFPLMPSEVAVNIGVTEAVLPAKTLRRSTGEKSPIPSLINATKLLGAIPALTQNSHVLFWVGWRELYEQAVAKIHAVAAEDIWSNAFAEGQALTMAQAATLALHELNGKQSHDA